MLNIAITDGISNTTIVRELNDSELKQHKADQVDAAQAEAEARSLAESTAIATAAAIAHAKSLGFTDDMIAVMYPNLRSESPIVP